MNENENEEYQTECFFRSNIVRQKYVGNDSKLRRLQTRAWFVDALTQVKVRVRTI